MNKKPLLAIGIVLSILNIIGLLIMIFGASSSGVAQGIIRILIVTSSIGILSLLSLVIYFVTGATKDKRFFYNAFLFLFALSCFLAVTLNQNSTQSVLTAVAGTILFGNALLLLVGKNLGRKTSLIIVACLIAASLLLTISHLIAGGGVAGALIDGSWHLLGALAMLTAILAKYSDKAERGRPMEE